MGMSLEVREGAVETYAVAKHLTSFEDEVVSDVAARMVQRVLVCAGIQNTQLECAVQTLRSRKLSLREFFRRGKLATERLGDLAIYQGSPEMMDASMLLGWALHVRSQRLRLRK